MKSQIQKILSLCIFLSITFSATLYAQHLKQVSGEIANKNSKQGISYATIMVYTISDSLVHGSISDEEGQFSFSDFTEPYYIKIECLGFQNKTINSEELKNIIQSNSRIYLEEDSQLLREFEVRAEQSEMEFKLDKRVFNVGQDVISQGGSALDVLNNVPSVDVNIEGAVSLRGNSNVLILINGKASVLTQGNAIGTITADMIDKVEVITNPSAKYSAEGTTGIINLIIKKEDKKGWNGALTINTGIPNNHSLGFSLNRRTEKFNLFSQMGVGYRTFPSSSKSYTIDKTQEIQSVFYTDSEAEKNEQFYNIVLGADYHISKFQMLTLTGHYGYEIEDENSTTNYKNRTVNQVTTSESIRKEKTESTNPKWEYSLDYEKKFSEKEKQKLTASFKGSYFGKDKNSSFTSQEILGATEEASQKTKNNFSEALFSFQSDYKHPFTENSILESGVKYEVSNLNNDYQYYNLEGADWQLNDLYSNQFDYQQKIAAAYTTYSHEWKKWSFLAGLRFENTDIHSVLKNTQEANNQNYSHLFPSLHASYKILNDLSAQLGYSKRIHRPRMWDLSPFATIRDIYNIEVGNPELQPELTDSYELTGISTWKKISLNASIFYRKTNNVITEVINVDGPQTITTIENIGKSNDGGLEVNGKWEALKYLSFLLDGQISIYRRFGEYQDSSFNFQSSYWSSRLTTKVKLPADIDIEIRGRYRSDYQDLQTNKLAEYYMDLGIKKKILKGRAVINLSVSDVFDTRGHTNVSDETDFYRYTENRRGGRRITLGFSFGFGKGEAMEYSGQKMF